MKETLLPRKRSEEGKKKLRKKWMDTLERKMGRGKGWEMRCWEMRYRVRLLMLEERRCGGKMERLKGGGEWIREVGGENRGRKEGGKEEQRKRRDERRRRKENCWFMIIERERGMTEL